MGISPDVLGGPSAARVVAPTRPRGHDHDHPDSRQRAQGPTPRPCGPRATTRAWSTPSCSRSGRAWSTPARSSPAPASSTSRPAPGNASIPAAQRGATVTASDLTPELLEAGSAPARGGRASTSPGCPPTPRTLPFEDESYDVVMSSIGVMFAPHHQAAADELVRVCRPGGTIGLLSWTPEGMLGALFATMKPFAPAAASRRVPAAAVGQRGAPARPVRRAGRVPHARDATRSRSRPSPGRATTASTSRPTTARPSRCARTPCARAARPSSTRLSTRSATPGTAAPPVQARFEKEYLIAVGTRA